MMFYKLVRHVMGKSFKELRPTQFRKLTTINNGVRLFKKDDQCLAYRVIEGGSPGILFCPGFQSNMMGVKANALEKYCIQNRLAYLRFDYRGCGQSPGNLHKMTLTDWKEDLLTMMDNLTAGPQIIVGSSIGGLLMLEAAEARPNRIHSLVGIATAADFSERLATNYPEEIKQQIAKHGVAEWTSEHHSYVLTKDFLDDAQQNHQLLGRTDKDGSGSGIRVTAPVRLLHGMEDESVPYDVTLKIAEELWSNDVNVTLSKLADHRFSQPEDIQLLFEMLDYLIHGAEEARELAITSWSSFTVYSHPRKIIKEKDNGHKVKERV